jgi:hypothetical protein
MIQAIVAELCGEYDELQRSARDPKNSSKSEHLWKLVVEKREEISSMVDVETALLAGGCASGRAAEASAELSYFATWMARRGGWVG